MHAFAEHADLQVAAGEAAQGSRAPELVVIAATGIQADDERGLADAIGQVIDVERQVVTARLLAGFDQDHAAAVRQALLLQRADRRQRTEDRVTVVGAAATE